MRIKSYFAKTVDEALSQARIELGPEALLLNTRKISNQGDPTSYEVVLGLAEAPPASLAQQPKPMPAPVKRTPVTPAAEMQTAAIQTSGPQACVTQADAPASDVAAELEKLRAQMTEIRELLSNTARTQAQRYSPELTKMHARLIASEVDPHLVTDIIERTARITAADPTAITEKILRSEMERRVSFCPRLGAEGGVHGAVTVLVGPTGCGKTTTLAKLAHAASAQHPVRLLSLDRQRQHQLELVKSRRKVTLATVSDLEKLPRIVSDARKKECVLIDTPGFSAGEEAAAETLASALAGCPDIDIQLVVPAYMKASDLRQCIERYQIFSPSKLLVTKLDEAQSFGTLYSEAARFGLAFSFVTNGPGVPNDIREVTMKDVVGLIEGRPQARAQSAA